MINQQTPGIIRDASIVNRQLPSAYAQCAGEDCDHLHSNGRVLHCAPIISAAARNNVPAVYSASDFVRDGGLLSYGPDRVDTYRRAASYVDRILRGEKPGDLPVQFPSKFEMVVNRRTAKALGLAIPPSILLRADEVIDESNALAVRAG
jgi:putative ABC transport system substrate-binding protein